MIRIDEIEDEEKLVWQSIKWKWWYSLVKNQNDFEKQTTKNSEKQDEELACTLKKTKKNIIMQTNDDDDDAQWERQW